MALFYFILRVDRKTFPDPIGEEFEDIADARAHAHTVARELMRNRENRTGHWRIQVCDDYLQPRYECLFAEVDQRLQAFGDIMRGSVIRVARHPGLFLRYQRRIGGRKRRRPSDGYARP